VVPFTEGLTTLPASMGSVVPFGETSLHDAIAQTARRVGAREGRHRAVVVLTDGNDNASRLTPLEVSGIASEIDVPVYLFGIVPLIDNPASEMSTIVVARSALAGPLAELAARTGGHMFVASSPGQRSAAARQVIDELRHQYLIAFESSGNPGWHGLVVRARQKDLTVRARNGYMAGQ
jgi:Ca-activated chloride channel family protein